MHIKRNRRTTQLSIITILLAHCVGCGPPDAALFRADQFELAAELTPIHGAFLCFDLGVANEPLAGLLLTNVPGTPAGRRNIAIPFQISDISLNEATHSMWGSYSSYTLISTQSPQADARLVFEVTPRIRSLQEGVSDISRLNHTVYFVKSGQERHFYYKYPPVPSLSRAWPILSREFETSFDAIAVALPDNHEPIVIPRTKSATSPAPLATNDRGVDFYSAIPTPDAKYLEIRYRLPLSPLQQEFVIRFMKLTVSTFIPMIALIFATPERVKRPRIRHRILWIGGTSEMLALALIGYFGYLAGGGVLTFTLTFELIEPLIGGVFSAYVASRVIRSR